MVGVDFKGAFRGETRRSLRTGFGVYQYPNPYFRYEGTWLDGKKHGFGKLMFGDGSYYQGEFANNEIIGQGTRYFATTGNTYTGQFYYGEMDGQGRLKMANGDCYEGDFKRNHFECTGNYLTHDKQLYSGQWHNHRRHGTGDQSYPDGSRYSGDWLANKRHGYGKLMDSHEGTSIYEGGWRNDLMHGEGTYVLGDSYVYRNGTMHNNYPIGWPFRFRINDENNPTIDISNEPTIINVEIVDSTEETNRIEVETGRLIRLRCGRKTDQPNANSLPTPFGFHVDLIQRNSDPFVSSASEDFVVNDDSAQINDSMLTVSDNGRAQFVGIRIDTFAMRPPSSTSHSTNQIDSLQNSLTSSQTKLSTKNTRKEKKIVPTFVFIIDDITEPAPFNKCLDAVYAMVQLNSVEST